MRKKLYITLAGFIVVLAAFGIRYFTGNAYETRVFAKNVCFFDENGFQEGSYEFAFDEEEKEQVLSSAYEHFYRELTTANEQMQFDLDFDSHFLRQWERMLEEQVAIFCEDKAGNVLRIGYYMIPNVDEKQHVLEAEVYENKNRKYHMSGGWDNNWPKEVEVCWNVEVDGNEVQKDELNYFPERFRILRLAKGELWAVNRVSGELLRCKMADTCEIWALLNPACHGSISVELLEESLQSTYQRDWKIGLNAQGEIAHIIEAMQP